MYGGFRNISILMFLAQKYKVGNTNWGFCLITYTGSMIGQTVKYDFPKYLYCIKNLNLKKHSQRQIKCTWLREDPPVCALSVSSSPCLFWTPHSQGRQSVTHGDKVDTSWSSLTRAECSLRGRGVCRAFLEPSLVPQTPANKLDTSSLCLLVLEKWRPWGEFERQLWKQEEEVAGPNPSGPNRSQINQLPASTIWPAPEVHSVDTVPLGWWAHSYVHQSRTP